MILTIPFIVRMILTIPFVGMILTIPFVVGMILTTSLTIPGIVGMSFSGQLEKVTLSHYFLSRHDASLNFPRQWNKFLHPFDLEAVCYVNLSVLRLTL